MNKKIVIFLTFFYLFLPLTDCHAFSGFAEDFSQMDSVNWNYTENGGSVSFNAGVMSLSSTAPTFPILHRKVSSPIFPPEGDSVFEVKFRYNKIYYNGSGIGIGFTGIGGKPFYQFQIWGDNTEEMGGIAFVHNNYNRALYGNCSGFQDQPYHSERSIIKVINDLDWHILRIERRGSLYQVFLDKSLGSDPIFTTEEGDCNPENIWLGNPLGGGTKWSYFSLDYMTSAYIDESTPRNKTIFLPGFGGSWNTEALVYNRPVADDSWVMTPFVKNYDRLIQSLIEGGYELGEDLFVWNYDWRKPVAENIFILNNFINSKTEETEKINLVGHSMGGLIARLWAQDGDNKSKINKVISLGSPHSGLVKAYEWFNGGKIPGDNDPGSIALAILYQLSRRTFSSDIEVLRSYVPSLRDVLPTFDFVAKGSRFISSDSLVERNVYLKNKNLEVDSIFDNLLAISGVGQKTVSGLLVGERSVFDKVLGKWPDGSPLKYIYGDGDGTVIKTSSFFDGDEFIEKSSNHGEIVDFSINEVLGELGIGITVDSGVSYDLGNKSIFFIGSPAYLKVNCDGIPETLSDSLGFVIVDSLGECQVEVVGTGSGTYHLVSGTTTNAESWRYFEKEISNGEIDTLSFKNGLLKTDQTNLAYLYKLIEYDAGKLLEKYPGQKDLLAVVNNAKSKNIDRLIVSLFDFRKSKKESTMSSSIIRTAESIMRIENQLLPIAKIKQAYTKAVQSKSLVDRITRLYLVKKIEPTKFGAESYLLLEQMLNQSGSDYAKSVLASKLASEVW